MKTTDLTRFGATKGLHFGHTHYINTPIGTAFISLRDSKGRRFLYCNFAGNEAVAKHKFGHWKVNTVINCDQDIENHLNYLRNG
tara:strand:+ start:68357 stop:68608 length:252 start_codon:yes stop_codon:yes gene_type:complete